MSAEQQLADARKAWHDKMSAEFQLSRLRRYDRLSPGMKDDQQRYSAVVRTATNTLARVLGGSQ